MVCAGGNEQREEALGGGSQVSRREPECHDPAAGWVGGERPDRDAGVGRPQHEPGKQGDPLSRGDQCLGHLAVVDAVDNGGVDAGVATAAVDHAEAGAVGAEVPQQPALLAQVGKADRPAALEPVAAWHDHVEGVLEQMHLVEVVAEHFA